MGLLGGLVNGLFNLEEDEDDETLGGTIGRALGGGLVEFGKDLLSELADDEEDKGWYDWLIGFEDEVNADYAYLEVKHEIGNDNCILTVYIIDESGKTIASNFFTVPYDKEMRELHKQTYKFHNDEKSPTLLEWCMSFNDNPDADHTYSEVKHNYGDENASVTVQIISKSGEIIASEVFYGPYENLKGLHKDISKFPINPETENEQKAIEPPKETIDDNYIEQKLIQLKRLYDNGLLTEEEFNEKKKSWIDCL